MNSLEKPTVLQSASQFYLHPVYTGYPSIVFVEHWKLTKMVACKGAACKLNFSFSKVCDDLFRWIF